MTERHIILLNVSGKRPIETEYKLSALDFFKLDLVNPRFNHINPKTEEEEEELIWNDKDTKVLFDSILASKGISEPIIAKENGTVIEGNRRIVCLRKIREEYGEDSEVFPSNGFKKIPTYIFPDNLDPVEQSIYLARLHVSGKKEWDAFNQAKYINNLKEKYKLALDLIASLIGMSKGKVYQKYWAFTEAKKFLEKYPQESITRYSFFEEAYKKKNMKDMFADEDKRNTFYNWIVQGKLSEAKDVRKLSKIMDDKELFSSFKKEGIIEAYHKYQLMDKIKEGATKSVKDWITTLRNIPRKELEEISNDKERVARLKELKEEIDSLLKQLTKR